MEEELQTWVDKFNICQGAQTDLRQILARPYLCDNDCRDFTTQTEHAFQYPSATLGIQPYDLSTIHPNYDLDSLGIFENSTFALDDLTWPTVNFPSLGTSTVQPFPDVAGYDNLEEDRNTPRVPQVNTTQQRRRHKATKREEHTACVRCWALKKKCSSKGPGLLCSNCSISKIPLQICVRERFSGAAVFIKWEEKSYGSKLEWQHLSRELSSRFVKLGHHNAGPSLITECQSFRPESANEVTLYWKTGKGWRELETTAFALKDSLADLSVDEYVLRHVTFYCQDELRGGEYLEHVLKAVEAEREDEVIQLTLRIWVASRLLVKGWTIMGEETLGMSVVENSACPLHGSIPAPRVLQNQLDRKLESYIAAQERKLLRVLQRRLRERQGWETISAAVIFFFHVLERDTWRLMYWVSRPEEQYKWRHPSTPKRLIDKNIYLGNLLLTHLRCARELPSAMSAQLKEEFDGKEIYRYNESSESSLDGHLTALLLEKDSLASTEKLALVRGST